MISAQDVKDLRERTGAGMMDCKKALTEADGDMEKAIDLLREKGLLLLLRKLAVLLPKVSLKPIFMAAVVLAFW